MVRSHNRAYAAVLTSNHRHEAFARALAEGATAGDAYEAAGYSRNDGNAGRLNRNEQIQSRVAELKAAIAERTVEKTALSKQWVINQLVANSRDAQGVGKYEASNAALKLIGQELFGMFVDRKETKHVDEFARMDDAELERFIAEQTAPAGAKKLTRATKVAGRA